MRKPKGFTLIELLVVIAVIVLLMAILMPTLQRVRKQAKAVACQSNLHQWGLVFSTGVDDNNGRFPWDMRSPMYYLCDVNDIQRCPMAWEHRERPDDPQALAGVPYGFRFGGKFLAWTDEYPGRATLYGSYGINHFVQDDRHEYFWRTPSARNAANAPVYLDGIILLAWPLAHDAPPQYDDAIGSRMSYFCINRHDGGINSLFMDWSVRKVRLKELWTLKWHRKFNTAGPWTKAGGVRPEDWPPWMQSFKDY